MLKYEVFMDIYLAVKSWGFLLSLFSAHFPHAKVAAEFLFSEPFWEMLDIISLSAPSCRILGALGGNPRGTLSIEERPFIHEHGRRGKY